MKSNELTTTLRNQPPISNGIEYGRTIGECVSGISQSALRMNQIKI